MNRRLLLLGFPLMAIALYGASGLASAGSHSGDDAPGIARRGADDSAGDDHGRGGHGADDPAPHARRGADDAPGHIRGGHGADDAPDADAPDDSDGRTARRSGTEPEDNGVDANDAPDDNGVDANDAPDDNGVDANDAPDDNGSGGHGADDTRLARRGADDAPGDDRGSGGHGADDTTRG